MRMGLVLTALLLPLGGCVVPPDQAYYGPAGYGYPGYAYSGGSGYAYSGYASDYAYPGYAYNSGSPTLAIEGATVPLIFYGGNWGYYDGYRNWHRAPEGVERQLMQRHPGGAGYRPYGGGQFGRPDELRPPGQHFSGNPGGNPGGFRPSGPPPGAPSPGGPPPAGFQARGFQPSGFNPAANHPGGFNPAVSHAGGPPPGGFQPPQHVASPTVSAPRAAPVGRPEGQHERHRDDQH